MSTAHELSRRAVAAMAPVPAQDGVFSDRLRRSGTWYVAITVPLVMVLSTFGRGERAYLVAFVGSSALYTVPALVVTWIATKRAPEADRPMWRVWFIGLVFSYLIGTAILVLVVTDWDLLRNGGSIAVLVGTIVYGTAIMMMIRARSGGRTLSIDVIEDRMLMLLVAAPFVLAFGDRIVTSEGSWFAGPAALAAAGMVSTIWLSISLFNRLDRGNRRVEGIGIALAVVGVACSCAQVAQGVAGFSLPFAPLIGLQALCMALVLLVPLHLPKTVAVGLDRLPLQQQVRGAGVVVVATLVVLPVLAVQTWMLRDQVRWGIPFTGGVVAVLLALSTLRHLLTIKETKRLYARVELAAEERQRLLAAVLQGADADRHRVAAQLHEQAVASYAAFVSYLGAQNGQVVNGGTTSASVLLRDDFNRQAEARRELMLAIRPIETSTQGEGRLTLPLRAFVDSLYGDRPAPRLTIAVDPDLVLDWTTETVVLRIVQEAIRNVARHAHATQLEVTIGLTDGEDLIEVVVADDGIGFDPAMVDGASAAGTRPSSGLACMRSFADIHGGQVTIASTIGCGTTVVARLGDQPAEQSDTMTPRVRCVDDRPHLASPRLQLVPLAE